MSPLLVSLVVVVCCCVSAVVGIILHAQLPAHHLESDSKDVVKSVLGVVATMAALVLGLLIASAKSTYDTQTHEIQQLAANIVQLDQSLALYGPETHEARSRLKQAVIAAHARIWPDSATSTVDLDPAAGRAATNGFSETVENLSPTTDAQRRAKDAALQLVSVSLQTRTLMFEQLEAPTPLLLLVVLISWISVLFLGFGLFARFHTTIAVTIGVGALSVASAIFLILELSQPYQGLMRVSDAPIRFALAHMNP